MQDVLQRILDEEVEAAGAPGGVVGVLLDGEVATAATGVTSVDAPAPLDDRTLFQVASITKTVAAFAVILLAEEGRLAVGDPVAVHLPDVAAAVDLPADLTIEHCLSHRVGVEGDHIFFHRARELTALADAERLFAPGEAFSYCNAGFSIAGAVIEAVTGTTFERFARERILEPLGMSTACFTADRAIFERVALPHWVLPDLPPVLLRRAGWQLGWELADVEHAAGGMAASAVELLAWAGCILDGGAGIVSREGVARLLEPVVDTDGGKQVALDWDTWDLDGTRVHAHGGLTVGYASILLVAPSRRAAVCCMVNSTNGSTVHRAVRRRVLAEVLGLDDQDLAASAVQPAPDDYVGTYRHSNGPIVVGVGEGDSLVLSFAAHPDGAVAWQPPPPPPVTVRFWAPDGIVADPTGDAGTFGRGPDGAVAWLRWSGRLAPRVRTP